LPHLRGKTAEDLPGCKSIIAPSDRFCGECGPESEISKSPARKRQKIASERKYITVLFADISGYTTLSERLDPEEVKDLVVGGTHAKWEIIHSLSRGSLLSRDLLPDSHSRPPLGLWSVFKNFDFIIKEVPFAKRKAIANLNSVIRVGKKVEAGVLGTVAPCSIWDCCTS